MVPVLVGIVDCVGRRENPECLRGADWNFEKCHVNKE